MDTELFKEFHHAFAMNAGACVHLETLYGKNSHHLAEVASRRGSGVAPGGGARSQDRRACALHQGRL